MQWRICLALLAVFATGCGDDDSGSTAPVVPTAFCDAWTAAMASGDDSAFEAVLAEVPAELADAAAVVRQAMADESESSEVDAAVAEIADWAELNCDQAGVGDSRRRVAPPIGAEFEGLVFCGTTAYPPFSDDGRSGAVLYGNADAGDPYDGPMLGVLWSPADDGGQGGDGTPEPVTVRGQDGVAAPITVFQQTILPELGTVIAWTEGERSFGVYGRGWPIDRADELVAIADRLEITDAGVRIPNDALPAGFGEVFRGGLWATSIVFTPSPLYSLRYQSDDGLLDVTGVQMSEDEFQAFRFFTVDVHRGGIGTHSGLVGNAWYADGPAVVTWRESDGLVVRIVGLSVALDVALQVAAESRDLSHEEWAALVQADDPCQQP